MILYFQFCDNYAFFYQVRSLARTIYILRKRFCFFLNTKTSPSQKSFMAEDRNSQKYQE